MTSIDLRGTLDVLAGQDMLLGVFLAGAGLVFMVVGFRLQRSLVAISFGILGFVTCSLIVGGDGLSMLAGLIGSVLFGTISTRYIKTAVVVLAGAWAGYAAALGAAFFELSPGIQAAIGFVAFGAAVSMSFIMHHEVTAFVLSFEGTLLVVGAAIIFLNQKPVVWGQMRDMVVAHPIFAPFVLLAGTVTGFYWQMSELRQRDAGTTS